MIFVPVSAFIFFTHPMMLTQEVEVTSTCPDQLVSAYPMRSAVEDEVAECFYQGFLPFGAWASPAVL